jgi:general secretion pathway protein D
VASGGLRNSAALLVVALLLAGCAGNRSMEPSVGHILDSEPEQTTAPPLVKPPPRIAQPKQLPPEPTYSVVVKDVPVNDLLFSLARDAGLELDLQSDNDRTITINAVEQPLRSILSRISAQAGLRYVLTGRNLIILEDRPYWYNYSVDYVNVSRVSEGEVGVATEISTTGGSVAVESGQQSDSQGNLSKTTVKNKSENNFWAALEAGVSTLVKMTAPSAGTSNAPEAGNPVISNPMAGVVTVFASQKTHTQVQTYLDAVMASARRQVLIEMTIVEVQLSDHHQAGVDWQRLSDDAGAGSNGVSFESSLLGSALSAPPFFRMGYNNESADGSSVSATVRLLQQFGDTKVLSSPKIMALNNQTALLKVVNEAVFFTIELDIREATLDIPERRTFTSELHTVPVGLVMSVTPQISENGYVSLNIRPTISRITGYAIDPAPRLSDSDFDNLIPEIQVQEIESLLQVIDGHTIVLGGLMQNQRVKTVDGIPGLSKIPGVGSLFSYTNDELKKTELVIFLRPTIIKGGVSPAGAPGIQDYYTESDGFSG